MFVRFRFTLALALTVSSSLLVSLTGCKPESPVSVQRVPKDRSGIQWMRDLGPMGARGSSAASSGASAQSRPPATPASATRMVVAIFQRPQAAWFFKITGQPEEVAKTESQWRPFFDSIKFESPNDSESGVQRPVWELPDRWTDGGTAQMVFAILKMPDTDAEVRISRLGGQQDLLSNVNRWRGQLSLPPATADSLDQQLLQIDSDGDTAAYRLFDQKGQSSGQSMGGPFSRGPFSGGQSVQSSGDASLKTDPGKKTGSPMASSPEKMENELAINPKFTLDPPSGYAPGKTSAMVVARFVKESVEGKVQISVVPLTATNQWDDNVNFWRQSVGLSPAKEGEIDSMTQPVSISGIDGKMIQLLAEESSDKPSLIGVMVKHDNAAWFFKMMGDREMVAEDQAVFDAFLKSFKFKN